MKQFLKPLSIIGITWALFQVYAAFASPPINSLIALPIHVSFALAMTFVAFPFIQPKRDAAEDPEAPSARAVTRWWDYSLAAVSALLGLYIISQAERIVSRIPGVDRVYDLDLIVGIVFVILVLEAARRTTGLAMTIVVTVFLAYQFVGKSIQALAQQWPGLNILAHRGEFTWKFLRDAIDYQVLQNQGIFGQPTQISYDTVFYFVIFGAFLEVSGAGQLFIDFALRLVGRFRGGPAKVAVVSSGLFGSISGSAVANVVGTGVLTIPMMKRIGYPAAFAGSVEAMASTGGQIMPPVMGAGAFLMAQYLGEPYSRIMLAALIPALIYYGAAYFMVDLKAAQQGLRGLKEEEIGVTWASMLRRLHLAVPLVMIVYLVVGGKSLMTAAMWTVGVIIAMMALEQVLWRAGREGGVLQGLGSLAVACVKALDSSARQGIQVAIPCAAAGMIVGVVSNTNLGVKFTGLVLALSGGQMLPALILIMLAVIIMGMGMPTTSAYIMGMILAVPALAGMGIEGLPAHMFIFYFACMSMLTPPVALAAYAASGIAKSNMWETGWTAFRISLAGFLVPYAFVYNPALLFIGPLNETLFTAATAFLGAFALAGGIVGYLMDHNRRWEGAALLIASLLLISPEHITDLIGAALLLTIMALQYTRRRQRQAVGSGLAEVAAGRMEPQ